MEKYISSNVARLSPVQCAVNLPEPANVDRDKTKGRLLRMVFSALGKQTVDEGSLIIIPMPIIRVRGLGFEVTEHAVEVVMRREILLCRWTQRLRTESAAQNVWSNERSGVFGG